MHFYKRIFLCRLLSSIDTSEGETYHVSGTTKEPSSFCPVTSRTVLSLVCNPVLCGQKVKHVQACPLRHFFSLCSWLVSSVTINTRGRNQNKMWYITDLIAFAPTLCRCEWYRSRIRCKQAEIKLWSRATFSKPPFLSVNMFWFVFVPKSEPAADVCCS